jgi:putative Ca2+/H+ antiporter (TMEM165/GDT1 family)
MFILCKNIHSFKFCTRQDAKGLFINMKTIILTFCLVFLAELGDKTQLATMMLAAKSESMWIVFLGSAMALVASSLICAFLGGLLTKIIPPSYIQYASGISFVIIGILLLTGKA